MVWHADQESVPLDHPAEPLPHAGARGTAVNHPAILRDRQGVTAVEYGIVAAFLCLSLLAIFNKFSTVLVTMFSNTVNGI